MKRVAAISFLVLSWFFSYGQDVHFSQFYSFVPNLNPALTGYFNGDLRVSAIHRDQWRSVTKPFNSFGVALDARNFLGIPNYGVGIAFFQDEAGDSNLKTSQVSLGQSIYVKLNKYKQQYIGVGAQVDYTERSINYSALTFDNQFNGYQFDGSRPTGENFATDRRSYLNANGGVSYLTQFGKRSSIIGGISLFNLLRPQQSFFNDEDVILDQRFNAHILYNYMLNREFDLVPSILYTQQNQYREIVFGMSAKYLMRDLRTGTQMLVFGIWTRWRDALIVAASIDHPNWKVGISYDFNLSTLVPASTGLGGTEFTAAYIFNRKKAKKRKPVFKINSKAVDCPVFM